MSSAAPISLVLRYSDLIRSAWKALERPWSDHECEQLAIYLLRTMGSESRDYHRPEHTLDVSRTLDPIPRIAAFFHDIVYVQVDMSWNKTLKSDLGTFSPSTEHVLNIPTAIRDCKDPWLLAITEIFGFETAIDITPPKGLNEFLSAIIFYQKMKAHLQPEELIRGIAAIEASILTLTEARGKNHFDKLKPRLARVVKKLGIKGIDETFYNICFQDCRALITQDRLSFALEKTGAFLTNSWDVLIENNPGLRNTFFLISEYRKAIGGTLRFLQILSPEALFWMDLEQENDRVLQTRTNKNLKQGSEYLRAIRNTTLILEVIAQESGGDAPLELFFGPIKRSREHQPICLEDQIPVIPVAQVPDEDQEVFLLLQHGRGNRSRFDRKDSPLAAYYFGATTKAEREPFEKACDLWETNQITNSDLLESVPRSVLRQILTSLESTAKTRVPRLKMLLNHYQ